MTLQELIDRHTLKAVQERTKVSVDNLLNLLNGDYDNLSKTNALGFLGIIEREYEVDLSAEKEKVKASVEDVRHVPQELLVTERRYKHQKNVAGGVLIFVVLLVAAGYILYLINYQNQAISFSAEEESAPAAQQVEAATEAEKQPPEKTAAVASEQNASQQEEDAQPVAAPSEPERSKGQTEPKPAPKVAQLSTRQKEENNATEPEAQKQEEEFAGIRVIKEMPMEKVVLQPEMKLWVGYVNLDSGARVQKNKENNITIDTNNTIIVTGHGRFTVGEQTYRQGERLYFRFIDGTLQELDEASFKHLNGNVLW